MITLKVYTRRGSATAWLRKLGVKPAEYDRFLTKLEDGRTSCDVDAATRFMGVGAVKFPGFNPEGIKTKVFKPPKFEDPKKVNISDLIRGMILGGSTNEEIWEVLKTKYNFPHSKRSYPTWYRCRMLKKGLLK
jgi:hypothetical protein